MNDLYKKNYKFFFADSVIFVNAMAFISIGTIIPYFLNALGASTFQISLASALVAIGTFISQPIFSKMALGLTYKVKTFTRILYLQRFIFLGYIVSIPILAGKNPQLTIILFLVAWGVFNFFVGSYNTFFMSIFSKSIPDNVRGRLLGYSGATANIIALGTAYLIGVLLKDIPFPYNCTVLFGFGILLLFLDVVDLSMIKEPPDEIQKVKQLSYLQYIREIPGILKGNKVYASMVAGYAFFVIANISLTYYALYAVRVFDAPAENMAVFTAISVAVGTIGNIVYGVLSDKYNHRLVLQIASFSAILAAVVVLGIGNVYAVYIAFALSTLCSCGYQLSCNVLIMQNCPQQHLPTYISINVMVTLVISSLVTLASGFIIDNLSFQAVFAMTGAAALGAFLVFMFLFRKYERCKQTD